MTILDLPPVPADRRVAYGPHPSQFADLYQPPGPGPHPAVILIHGGYWRAAYGLEHMSHLAAALRARGVAGWSLEYRRLGSGGGWPATFEDVAAGADAVAGLGEGLELSRVLAAGFSAGGQLALWLLGRGGEAAVAPRAAVSLAGVVDLRRGSELGLSGGAVDRLLGGAPAAHPERLAAACPYQRLPVGRPQLLVHGLDDQHVPPELSRRYAARARQLGDDVELDERPGVGHFELIDPRGAPGQRVVDQIVRLTGQAA